MNTKRILASLLAFSMLFAVGCSAEEVEEENLLDGTAIEVESVVAGDISSSSRLSGKVIAAREVSVYPPIPAKVLSVNVGVGDVVAADQVLFSLDKEDIEKNYQPLLDNYNRSKTLFEEQVKLAQKNVEDTEALLEIGVASQSELDQAKLSLLSTQTNMDSTLSQLDESMKDVRKTLEDTTVKSTISGVVTSVSVVAGGTASQSVPAVVVSESQKPQVLVSVSENVQPYLKSGARVICTIEALGGEEIIGTIDTVAPASSAQTQLYEVRVNLPSGTNAQIGMFVDVTFFTNSKSGVVLVPTEAILTDGQTDYVFVVNAENKAEKKVVTTGLASDNRTEVTSGLEVGQLLVTVGQSYLSDGALVRIVTNDASGEE